MTALDWMIIAFTLLLACYGYVQGLITGALSLIGFIAGAFAGTRLAPLLLPRGAASPYAPAFGLAGALLAGGILAGGLEAVGLSLRRRLRVPGLRALDGALGALLTACLALGLVWIAGAVALQTPGARSLRHDIQRSFVLRQLNQLLPAASILHALARFDPLPAFPGSPPAVAPPSGAILHTSAVARARGSVVRVLGTACGLGVEGSGWVAGRGIVVTNAHVVAGESDTVVQVDGAPPGLRAHAIWFDPRNDIALLRVGGLNRPPLALAGSATVGDAAAIVGYPLNGPFNARPARLGQTAVVESQDAYGRGPVQRLILTLRGRVREGNSGGPLIDSSGAVVGTVFASLVGRGGGYAVPDAVVRDALSSAGRAVGTGPCAR
ncbi:MAG TPA: MarP family serine protease [Solirubrobacteraceae bacterium]|nr:MarP family serine protease [Solirubrobacteraceae bacterium]